MHRARTRSMLCAKHSSWRESSLMMENARDLNRRAHTRAGTNSEDWEEALRTTAFSHLAEASLSAPYVPAVSGDASRVATTLTKRRRSVRAYP